MDRRYRSPWQLCGVVLLALGALPVHAVFVQEGAAWDESLVPSAEDRLVQRLERELQGSSVDPSGLREVCFSVAALRSSERPAVRSVAERAAAWLCSQQAADGGFGLAAERHADSWFACLALQRSTDEASLAALERLRTFLERQTEGAVPPARAAEDAAEKRPSLSKAMEFLERRGTGTGELTAGPSWAHDETLERLFAAAGGPFDARAAYASELRTAGISSLDFARAQSIGAVRTAMHAHLVRASLLARYGNPRISTLAGEVIWWPERFTRAIETELARASHAPPGGMDRPDESVELASSLLALEILRPWIGLSPADLEAAGSSQPRRPANLGQDCESCHSGLQPKLSEQWSRSAHARAGVGCADCHGENHSLVFREEGRVSPAVCGECHPRAAEEFARSRHARAQEHLLASALFDATPAARRESCFACHRIGAENLDGTSGSCNACHASHEFNAAQARTPEACTICHVGEDYPQDLAYRNSVHGSLWTLTRDESVAPTCATCHHPLGNHDDSFGMTLGCGGTGGCVEGAESAIPMRSFTAGEIAERRAEMIGVCSSCHSSRFSDASLREADAIKIEGDGMLAEAAGILRALHAEGLVGEAGEPLLLGGEQLRSDPSIPGADLLDRFYRMWRFDQAWAFKGAYHSSPSVANRQSLPGLEEGLEYLRHRAQLLRQKDKR